jgi:hypothetical protein
LNVHSYGSNWHSKNAGERVAVGWNRQASAIFGLFRGRIPGNAIYMALAHKSAQWTHTGSDKKIKPPATIAIKHQIRKMMFDEVVKKAEAEARVEAVRVQLREETRPVVHSA